MTIEERFWSKVDKSAGPKGCWLWMAGKDHGYGRFDVSHSRHVQAHRFAYELVKGPIPAGLDVCHSCDNHPCCNPAHLWPGTALDNMQDCASKGRRLHLCGELNSTAKLTEKQVREIRRLFAEGQGQRAISRLTGVPKVTVWRIVHRTSWRHIPPEIQEGCNV